MSTIRNCNSFKVIVINKNTCSCCFHNFIPLFVTNIVFSIYFLNIIIWGRFGFFYKLLSSRIKIISMGIKRGAKRVKSNYFREAYNLIRILNSMPYRNKFFNSHITINCKLNITRIAGIPSIYLSIFYCCYNITAIRRSFLIYFAVFYGH